VVQNYERIVLNHSFSINKKIRMRTIIITLLLLLNGNIYSKSIEDYYSLINEAELLICDNKIEHAVEHYDKAFENKDIPFGKDLYNAWLCSYMLDDTVRFKRYSISMIKCGAFLHQQVHENMLKTIGGKHDLQLFSDIWNRLKQSVKSGVNENNFKALERFLNEDQAVRHFFQDSCGERNYNTCGRDSLNVFDSLNVEHLFKYFAENGFPTEQKYGYQNCFPTNPPRYQLILQHDRQWNGPNNLIHYCIAR
jgi:hypothetical protein